MIASVNILSDKHLSYWKPAGVFLSVLLSYSFVAIGDFPNL